MTNTTPTDEQALRAELARHFQDRFTAEPGGVGQAHGRVNLIGEHIDYNGGMVLPAAIEARALIAVGRIDGAQDSIDSTSFGESCTRPIGDPRSGHWSDYVAGALAAARSMRLIAADQACGVVVRSDIAFGAGLSSSAAVIVATLKALAELAGQSLDNVEIAKLAQRVEHEYIGMPCGIMDQMAVAIATPGQVLALDTHTLSHQVYALPAGVEFAIMHSGIVRKLDEGRYAERRAECEAAQAQLGAEQLCLLTPQQRDAIATLPDVPQRRARHVYSEHRRVLAATDALQRGDMVAFGKLMNESHASMRDDFEMSAPLIDEMVAVACQSGALGARLTGGGFGGCIVACVRDADVDAWRQAMNDAFEQAYFVY